MQSDSVCVNPCTCGMPKREKEKGNERDEVEVKEFVADADAPSEK